MFSLKKEKNKPKANGRKEIIVSIDETATHEYWKSINKTKKLLKKINKLLNHQVDEINKKKKKDKLALSGMKGASLQIPH